MTETSGQQTRGIDSALIQEIRKLLDSGSGQGHTIDPNKDATLISPEEFFAAKPGFWKDYFGRQQ